MVDKKRVAIFAHYDKDDVVDDYVVYYLNALKEVAQKIVFVSDCDLPEEEKNKLQNVADVVIAEPHGEYDFGSYKRGFLSAMANGFLNGCDECVFTNDSCFGPFNSLVPIFESMEDADFWGITQNKFGIIKKNAVYLTCKKPHLQSYFLVFKNNVFTSKIFVEFMNSIKKEETKTDIIINYEIGLTETLVGAGFKPKSYIEAFFNTNAPILYKWDKLISDYDMPFLKCSLPRLKHQRSIVIDGYEQVIEKVSKYPVELIKKNAKQTGNEKRFKIPLPMPLLRFCFKMIYNVKIIIKEFLYFCSKICP